MEDPPSDIPLLLECEEGYQETDSVSDNEIIESSSNIHSTDCPDSARNNSLREKISNSSERGEHVTSNNNLVKGEKIDKDYLFRFKEVTVSKIEVKNVESRNLSSEPGAEVVDLTEDDENVTPIANGGVHGGNTTYRNFLQHKNPSNKVVDKKTTAKSDVQVVDLTEDDESPGMVKSVLNEKSGNNSSSNSEFRYKISPSVIVKQKPILRRESSNICSTKEDNNLLANKVKGTLTLNAMKLTEWLINEGLLNAEQYCKEHTEGGRPIKLKLGMYSNTSKFPFSGGYVWISGCCPSKFVSVFRGSIFEDTVHRPDLLLKLIFHWACQTDAQYIEKWVDVDKNYMEDFFNKVRCVCTAVIHEKYGKLGGKGGTVQVGTLNFNVMNANRVKFKVLGALDIDNKLIRLEVLDPASDKNVYASITRLLERWIHKDTVLVTNCLLIKGNLMNSGFMKVSHNSLSADCSNFKNINVIQYLSGIVPKVFQGMKPMFSCRNIQLFLNEVVWRERWGYSPVLAFETLIKDIAGQTKPDVMLVNCLSKISLFPFITWEYCKWEENCSTIERVSPEQKSGMGSTRSRVRNIPHSDYGTRNTTSSWQSESTGQSISLDSYYYGEILGDTDLMDEYSIAMECFMCKRYLPNNIEVMHHCIRFLSNGERCINIRSEAHICTYCLMVFRTPVLLNAHCEEEHFKIDSRILCRICNVKFNERGKLLTHMSYFHNELELPYSCGVCGYRASEHYLMVDHFYEDHKDCGYLLCPLCLKVFNCKMSCNRFALYQYLWHIKKHSFNSLVFKCNRCALTFVDKDSHKLHWDLHNSCKMLPYAKKYKKPSHGVLMPKPQRAQAAKVAYQYPNCNITIFPVAQSSLGNQVKSMDVSKVPEACCFECEGRINELHFGNLLSCRRCSYVTQCANAMQVHVEMLKKKDLNNLNKPFKLERPMQCPCGLKFLEGNRLSRHLILCGKKTAYMLPDTPPVLLSLGLIRKCLLSDSDFDENCSSTDDCESDMSARRSKRIKLR